MAASQEELDNLRNNLTARGLLSPGLGTQAIQRTNLPELGPAVQEAQATRAALEESRKAGFARQLLQGRPKFSPGGGGGGVSNQFNPNAPSAMFIAAPPGTGLEGKQFGLTYSVGGTGQKANERFTNFDQAFTRAQELQKLGIQVALPGVQSVDQAQLAQLQGIGASQISDVAAQRAFLGRQRTGILNQLKSVRELANMNAAKFAKPAVIPSKPKTTSSIPGVTVSGGVAEA